MNLKQWKVLGSFVRNDDIEIRNISKTQEDIRLLVNISSRKTYTEFIINKQGGYSEEDKIQF